jgi:serine/threonine protein kinase
MEVADTSIIDSPLEKYELAELLGEGGSGSTYRAIRLADQTSVAIKVLSLRHLQDWKQLELFEREAKVLSQLSHPQIPQYLDYFHVDTPDNRAFYIVQQLAPGKPLTKWVQCGWRGTEMEIKDIAQQLLEILKYLHQQSPPLVHRDIKPHNIIRSDDGRVFLVDFGAVQNVYRSTFLKGSTVAGTYGYMAPEQFRGAAVPGSDLYGLGATVLYLLTHRSPAELPQERLKLSFRSHVNISQHFADWLEIMLEPDVIDRFSSADKALTVLKNWYGLRIKQNTKNGFPKKETIAYITLLISIYVGYQYRYAVLEKLSIQPRNLCIHNTSDKDYLTDLKEYLNHGGDVNRSVDFFDPVLEGYRGTEETPYSLLDCAVSNKGIESVKFLLDKGVDPNRYKFSEGYSNRKGYIKTTVLHSILNKQLHKIIENYEFMKLLLERGANPNLPDQSGDTPLHKLVSKVEPKQMVTSQ